MSDPNAKTRYCALVGCMRPAPRSKFCDMHRKRISRHGTPGGPERMTPPRIDDAVIEQAARFAGIVPRVELARIHGISPTAMCTRLTAAGVTAKLHAGRKKLDADQVREIRRRVADGELQKDLAVEFGVTADSVSLIIRRRTWRDV